MVSKQEAQSMFDIIFNKFRLKKWALVFFECIIKPRTAKEIMNLRKINDLSNAKKHLNEAVKEGYLDSWTEKGIRYWYVTDKILNRLIISGSQNIKELKRIGKRNLKNMWDYCLKVNPKGLETSRKTIYEDFKAKYG